MYCKEYNNETRMKSRNRLTWQDQAKPSAFREICRSHFLDKIQKGANCNLFQLVKNFIGVGKVPIEQELVDYGEIFSSFRKSGEYLLDVALGLLLYQSA